MNDLRRVVAPAENGARKLLVDMLGEASQLEHSLLNAYLYAACSLKSTPQEFAQIGGQENKRRAIQYERARTWKQSILAVAHEEMRHLHYVQCMIRALGERPNLSLPKRDANGNWRIPNWQIQVGAEPVDPKGTSVPVTPLDETALKRFVLYESTDALQDGDPFGTEAMALYGQLYEFELALRFESMLVNMEAGAAKDELRAKLVDLYKNTRPVDGAGLTEMLEMKLPPLDEFQFQSIADFYRKGILPLYQQAFEESWVVVNDRNLVDEQLNPDYAAEGFLPVGPIGRSARFSRFANKNAANPLADYKQVADIVDEIVAEGEGAVDFEAKAKAMLAKVGEIGLDGFLAALASDRKRQTDTPDWLAQAQDVRKSHLYTFAMILMEYRFEQDLARASGVSFEPAREAQPIRGAGLAKLTEELPRQFNGCYVAMLAWLSRMYESRGWASDQSRRMAIEMVATWPLMSLAIRPFLELASFFPVDLTQMFGVDRESVPLLPPWAPQLVELYYSHVRSEAINAQMDQLVVRVLKGAAAWAQEQVRVVQSSAIPDNEREMIITRLKGLSQLGEFERQFPYRVAGGYSDRAPNLTYQNRHPESRRFEEDPSGDPDNPLPLFADKLVMRLRFRGWGLVQLATDPDPPTDESGCSGTIMLHPADGDRRLDRALVFQDYEPGKNIRRAVKKAPPPLGVDCVEVALMAPELITRKAGGIQGGAWAGYTPLQVLSSSGAVQTSGVQQDLAVQGLHTIATVDAAQVFGDGRALQVYLESKDGQRPFLNGDNHLIWQDGEPIDPFVLSVYAGPSEEGGKPQLLFQREIFNEGFTLREMEPYERLLSCRGPVGFDSVANTPEWALTPEVRNAISTPGFPNSFLRDRSNSLAEQLQEVLAQGKGGQKAVDEAVSLAERMLLTAQPRSTTVNWLRFLLHYGHTLSGDMQVAVADNAVLKALEAKTQLGLTIAPKAQDRTTPNARWLAGYTKGMMDVDAMSDFVYGELYIPLVASGGEVRFERSWSFPLDMHEALSAYACNFEKPFWDHFDVKGEVRTVEVKGLDPANPAKPCTLRETLTGETANGYEYDQTGFPGMASYRGEFTVSLSEDRAILRWVCHFQAEVPDAMVRCYALLANGADVIGAKLGEHFAPGLA
jgi:hypothetical protein